VPYGNDQFFNGWRVLELGLGAAAHPHRSTVTGVARLLEERVLSKETGIRAQQFGATIRAERGCERLDPTC
jgi:UDP:flavonoid glycosyltransferase YjiC (YdhE family)